MIQCNKCNSAVKQFATVLIITVLDYWLNTSATGKGVFTHGIHLYMLIIQKSMHYCICKAYKCANLQNVLLFVSTIKSWSRS